MLSESEKSYVRINWSLLGEPLYDEAECLAGVVRNLFLISGVSSSNLNLCAICDLKFLL